MVCLIKIASDCAVIQSLLHFCTDRHRFIIILQVIIGFFMTFLKSEIPTDTPCFRLEPHEKRRYETSISDIFRTVAEYQQQNCDIYQTNGALCVLS